MASLTNACHCLETVAKACDALTPNLSPQDAATVEGIRQAVQRELERVRRIMVVAPTFTLPSTNRVRSIASVADIPSRIWLGLDVALKELQTAAGVYRHVAAHDREVIESALTVVGDCIEQLESLDMFDMKSAAAQEGRLAYA